MGTLLDILKEFDNKRIVVVGDIMLDKYIDGEVSRISPEAPVPVVVKKYEQSKMGGAGNVASNISSLGGEVSIFSFIGKDPEAEILKNILKENKIEYRLDEDSMTVSKIRIIGNGQQLIRIDHEEKSKKVFSKETKETLKKYAERADIIVISDYDKGAVNKDTMNFLEEYKKKIVVNPKPSNKNLYKRTLLVIPNEKEALEMSRVNKVYNAGKKLQKNLETNILVTRGERGMTLFSDNVTDIPTYAQEVYDVQGAGDTVVATVALALAAGSSLEEAAKLGNYSAGIAVEKKGTYSVRLKELKKRISLMDKKKYQ